MDTAGSFVLRCIYGMWNTLRDQYQPLQDLPLDTALQTLHGQTQRHRYPITPSFLRPEVKWIMRAQVGSLSRSWIIPEKPWPSAANQQLIQQKSEVCSSADCYTRRCFTKLIILSSARPMGKTRAILKIQEAKQRKSRTWRMRHGCTTQLWAQQWPTAAALETMSTQ